MDPIRFSLGIAALGFVLITHLIGFNNVRFGIFWIPEFVLIIYAISTLVPFGHIPNLAIKLKSNLQNYLSKRTRRKKVVKFRPVGSKRLPLAAVMDGLLITAVVCLSFYLLYRI